MLIKLYSPDNEIELALIKSLLEGSDIPYYVQNDHFGSMYIGPQIRLFNRKMVMVPPAYEEGAKEVLADFLRNQEAGAETPAEPEQKTSIRDKFRMFMEVLLFFWVVPGKRWTGKKKRSDSESVGDE
ncbi:hypothetical protein DSOUD_0523 [Desulfuromonas soudanensis]|uniref:DUF2007 domain-containing protein n=1 Tax=Desulfuromonas soudanensis TaxID=1603606 RepID=A0A0M3QF20_9BACT|nr:DUF2007 domain-containing protein [Desulfuromonas soudanensis]ALC15313.1 hypothetical protein DSOUD_0523 [Desulfuromonas soudanensis]